jgi:PAS domain S-box-containing protein
MSRHESQATVDSHEDLQRKLLRFQKIVETAREGIWEIDLNGKTLAINPMLSEFMQYTEAEMIEKSFFDFMDEESRSIAAHMLADRSHGRPETHEFKFIRKDQSEIWLNISACPLLDASGHGSVFAFCADITERKQRESELAQTIRYYDDILEGAGLGAWDWWLETNEVRFDRRWCEMLGLQLEKVSQDLSTWDARVHPEDKAQAYEDIQAYLQGKTPVYENIHRMLHENGSWVWILDRGRVSERDREGKAIRFTGTHFEITGYQEAAALSESIQKIGNIGGWELDVATQKTKWTDQTYRIHQVPKGTPTDKVKGIEFYAPHEQERIARFVKDCIEGQAYRDVFEFIDAKGNRKWVDAAGEPIKNADGQVYKLRGTFQDVTDKKEIEIKKNAADAHFQAIFGQSQDAIMTLGPPSFHFTSCNRATLGLFQVRSEEDFIQMGLWDLSPDVQPTGEKSADLAKKMIKEAMEKGVSFFEWTHKTMTEKAVPCTVLLSKVEGAGVPYLQATVRDITIQKQMENDLKTANVRLQTILDHSPSATYECAINQNWTMSYISHHIEEITGYPAQEFIHDSVRTYASIIHPEDVSDVESSVSQAIESQTSFDIEYRVIARDSKVHWIWERGTHSVLNGNLVGVIFDITDRKEAENALLLKTKELDQFFNLALDLLCIADINGWFKKINSAFASVLGYSPEDLLSRPFLDFIHPDDLDRTMRELEKLQSGVPTIRFENRYRCKDGSYRVLNWISSPDPATGYIYAAARDMTDQIQAQEENRFVLDTLNIGVWKFNPQTRDLSWDKKMFEIHEMDHSGDPNDTKEMEKILSREGLQLIQEDLALALRGDKEFDVTTEICTPSGRKKFIASRAQVVRGSEGESLMVYGVTFDRTKEVEMELALQEERAKALHSAKLASLGEMSAGIAHEINNPLAIISGMVSFLHIHRDDPEKFSKKVKSIQDSVDRISKIVLGLRKFSRSSDGMVHETVSLRVLIDESLVLTDAKLKRFSVVVNLDLRSDSFILCDQVEIQQVLINLINNAIDSIKELPEKWIRVSLFEEASAVVFQMNDSGRGIAPEIEPKLFLPFFTTKPVGEGTGLGLSICKGILDQHQASFELNRKISDSCFEIRFPKPKEGTVAP